MTVTITKPDAEWDVQWRRLSPRMLLIHPVVELGRAIPAIVGLLVAGTTSGGGSQWGLIGAGVVIALGISHWFTTRYRIGTDQIQLRRGLLRRVTVSAPLDRVRTVDVTAHLLHRALGLAKVAIGTGTSDRKGRTALVLDGLSATSAARLRAELLHRPGAAETAAETAEASAAVHDPEREIARLDPAWVRYAPFTLSGAITSLAVLGFGWRLINEAHIDLSHGGPTRAIADRLRHAPLVLDVIAVALAILLIITVASVVGYVLAFWRFRLTRHDGGSLHISRGLITSRATSIERRRLVGAELSEPLLLRAVGGARCVAIATGLRVGRGAERGGQVLLPPAPRAASVEVIAAVLGSNRVSTAELRRHPRAALRRRIVRVAAACGLFVAVIGGVVAWSPVSRGSWFASLIVFVGVAPLAIDRYRSLGHAVVDGYLVTRFGSLVRRRSIVSCDAVIGWNFRSSFFQRRVGLTTLRATSAAGKQHFPIVDVAQGDAVALANSVTPGLLTPFVV
ncbi:MAG TPA: PH domain-containing protein [Jatrophihabitantaceae bacterium]|nr:PH domain-containing protein [Jatrophihabitantaceae bacterium]